MNLSILQLSFSSFLLPGQGGCGEKREEKKPGGKGCLFVVRDVQGKQMNRETL